MALIDNFVANLRQHCEAAGIHYKELAAAANVHPVTVSRILNLRFSPSLKICEQLAKAAGMRADTAFLEPLKKSKTTA